MSESKGTFIKCEVCEGKGKRIIYSKKCGTCGGKGWSHSTLFHPYYHVKKEFCYSCQGQGNHQVVDPQVINCENCDNGLISKSECIIS